MDTYHYHALDKDGQSVKGTLEAEDKAAFLHLMEQQGLFPVSWNTHSETPVEEVPTSAASSETPEGSTSNPEETAPPTPEVNAQQSPARKKMRWMATVGVGVFILVVRFYQTQNPSEPANLLNQKLAQIYPGMTRENAEKIFTVRSNMPAKPGKALYSVPPGFTVEITYDRQGGPDGLEDRIKPGGISLQRKR